MIVDAAHLADVPADRENFKKLALVDEIPRVVALGIENVGLQSLGLDGFLPVKSQHAGNGEFFFGNGAELLHPFIDRELLHGVFVLREVSTCSSARLLVQRAYNSYSTSLYLRATAMCGQNRRAARVIDEL